MKGGYALSKTKKALKGVASAIFVTGIAGCGTDSSLPPEPESDECRDWDWDDSLGVWVCDDGGSGYYRSYYYGGSYYRNTSALAKSSDYKSYSKSTSFKGSSGFGSGSKSFGG